MKKRQAILIVLLILSSKTFAWEDFPAPSGHPCSVFLPHVAIWDNSTILFPLRGQGMLIYREGEWIRPAMNGFPTNEDSIIVLPNINSMFELDNPWFGKTANIYKLFTHEDRPNRIWCIERNTWRIYHSSDMGENWEKINDTGLDDYILDFDLHPLNPDTMIVNLYRKTWMSFNGGESWEPNYNTNPPEYPLWPIVFGLQFNPANPDEIIHIGILQDFYSGSIAGVWVTDIHGDTIRTYEENPPAHYSNGEVLVDTTGVGRIAKWTETQLGYGMFLIFEGTSRDILTIGEAHENRYILGFNDTSCDLYTLVLPSTIRHYPPGWTNDNRRELTFDPIPLDSIWIAGLASPDNETVFLTTDCGIIKSEDSGETGEWVENLPTRTSSYAIDAHPTFPSIFSWGDDGLFNSQDNGNSWHRVLFKDGIRASFSHDRQEFYYANLYNEFIRLTPQGEEIARISFDDRITGLNFSEDKIFLLTNSGLVTRLWESADGGINWESNYSFAYTQFHLNVDPQNSDKMYISGRGLFSSDDEGQTWIEHTIPDTSYYCPATYTGFANDLEYVVATKTGLFKTNDGGATWNRIPSDFRCLGSTDIRTMPRSVIFYSDPEDSEGFIVLAAGLGLWRYARSTNSLLKLVIPDDVFPADLTILPNGHYLLASSDGRLFESEILLDVPEWEEKDTDLPTSYNLSVSLYPNPFNDSQIINIQNIINQDVEISLFTVDGRLIGKTTINSIDSQIKVPLSEFIDTRTLASGVYLIDVRSGKQHHSLKSVLIQ